MTYSLSIKRYGSLCYNTKYLFTDNCSCKKLNNLQVTHSKMKQMLHQWKRFPTVSQQCSSQSGIYSFCTNSLHRICTYLATQIQLHNLHLSCSTGNYWRQATKQVNCYIFRPSSNSTISIVRIFVLHLELYISQKWLLYISRNGWCTPKTSKKTNFHY